MQGLGEWVPRLSSVNLPVLRATAGALEAYRQAEDQVTPRELATLILHDPLMSVKVLRFSQARLTSRQLTEVTTVEHAIMMHGVARFFREFQRLVALEDLLASQPLALEGALAVISRAAHAAVNARNFSALRHDVESEEVMVSALLHDLAELLLWCTAPATALQIDRMLAQASGLRSVMAQRAALGFRLAELQLALADAWRLPRLLSTLMDDAQVRNPRVQTVRISVALARHTAHGWHDPALPDDYKALQALLNIAPDAARRWAVTSAVQAARKWRSCGARPAAAWLPMLPGAWPATERGEASAPSPAVVDTVLDQFAAAATRGIERKAAVALAVYAFEVGLGLRRIWFGTLNAKTGRVEAVHTLWHDPGLAPADLVFDPGPGHLLGLLWERGQAVWYASPPNPTLAAMLPPTLREKLSPGGFFAMALQPGFKPRAIVYADAGSQGTLDSDGYNAFKSLCAALTHALDHAVD